MLYFMGGRATILVPRFPVSVARPGHENHTQVESPAGTEVSNVRVFLNFPASIFRAFRSPKHFDPRVATRRILDGISASLDSISVDSLSLATACCRVM